MKKLLPYFFAVLMALFIFAVALAVLYYSYSAVSIIFPNDLLGQLFGMVLFDIAAFVWFGAFIYLCKSTMQYVWAGFGFFIGLSGALGLIAIEVGLSSGLLARADILKPLTYIFIGVLFGHLLLIYATHASAPEVSSDISLGIETAKIVQAAQDQAEQHLMQNQNVLAGVMARKLIERALTDMNLQNVGGQILELPALDVLEEQSPASVGKINPLAALFARFVPGKNQSPRKYEKTIPAPIAEPASSKEEGAQAAAPFQDDQSSST